MGALELFIDEIDGKLYTAVADKGRLINLYVDRATAESTWASLYLGRVVKIDTKLDAAIVDIGGGKTGFLQAKHVRMEGADSSESRSGIAQLLKGGQMVMVQIKAEGKKETHNENHKMPRLTMKLYIPGVFVAYSPLSSQVTISSRIESERTIALTSKLKGKGGWIVQVHADRATEDDIDLESKNLQEKWARISSARDGMGDKPGLLMAGPNGMARALFDHGVLNFEHIYAGSKKTLDMVADWCSLHLPALAGSKRLRLFKPEKAGQKLFDLQDIAGQIDDLKNAEVPLPSGGSIIVENTSAMTVIDVNQGSAGNITTVNQEAAMEVARQVRLRSLSGAILIDFINMDQKPERARLLETMEEAVANDAATTQVHGFTRLGIIEMTRKRRSATLMEKLKY